MMKIKFLAFLSFVLLLGATAFGVQNCSKKDKTDPIVGKWRLEKLVAADGSKDLSCVNKEALTSLAELLDPEEGELAENPFAQYEFFDNGKVQVQTSETEDILENDWKKIKDGEYEIGTTKIRKAYLTNGKLQFHIPFEGNRKSKQQRNNTIGDCVNTVIEVYLANQLKTEYKKI